MFISLLVVVALGAPGEELSTKFVAKGATKKAGGYRPIQAELKEEKGEGVEVQPFGMSAPKYGVLKLGENSYGFIIDEPEGKLAALYVDGNRDGDYTNDSEASWNPRSARRLTMYFGTAEVDLAEGVKGTVQLYRFDPKDPQREKLKNTLLYYADYGQEVTIPLDDKKCSTFVAGSPDEQTQLWIDRDGNGQQSVKRETVRIGKPFNYTGTTYQIDVAKGKLTLTKAADAVPLTPLPPELKIGKPSLPFAAKTMDGTKIDFPKTYAGKLVMLDFWATWCGPCIAELPNVKDAYSNWHEHGFEILGISFDEADQEKEVAAFTKKNDMPWQQIYEGKVWDTTLGELYDVGGIPFVLLIDGDTGEILATERDLHGPTLSAFIGKALEKKKGKDF